MNVTLAAQRRISADQRERMFALHDRYFADVRRAKFMADLAAKHWVILLQAGDTLAGFSTIETLNLPVDGAAHTFLFSGDTIVEQAHRRSPALAGAFGHFMLRTIKENGGRPIHWFLITKGPRTYRFLPVFFREFHPTCDRPTPLPRRRLLDAVAQHKFPETYDPDSGIVRNPGDADSLRTEHQGLPRGRTADRHVRFFLSRNPGWTRGDELACLAEVSEANLNRAAFRVIRQTRVEWIE
jgi:hypothetical protein